MVCADSEIPKIRASGVGMEGRFFGGAARRQFGDGDSPPRRASKAEQRVPVRILVI